MKRIATVYDMMISSPNDTKEEVSAVFESIMDFNRNSASQEASPAMVRILKWNTDVFLNSNFDLETSEELPYNQCGEVCMTGPNAMLGYYNNPTVTSEVI